MIGLTNRALGILLGCLSGALHAGCTQNNNELNGLVGLDSEIGSVYAATTSVSNECSCAAVRFRPEITDTKMALSVLLSAKLAGKKVRVDLLDASDCNSAFRVYVQN